MTGPNCAPGNRDFYLGPALGLVKLTVPDGGYSVTVTKNAQVHPLIGGLTAVQRNSLARRGYQLNFGSRTADTADQIVAIYDGLLGRGPYYFVDPSWRNVLPAQVSSCGKRKGTSVGFIAAGSVVAYAAAADPPPLAPLSGVQAWSGIGPGDALYCNATDVQILGGSAPPVIPGEPITVAVWLRTVAATMTVQLSLYCNDSAGAFVSAVPLTSAAVTTSWQRFSCTLPPGGFPANAATFGLVIGYSAGGADTVQVAALDAQYVTGAATGVGAAGLAAWVHGLGVPKVNVAGDLPSTTAPVFWRRTHTLTLVESA